MVQTISSTFTFLSMAISLNIDHIIVMEFRTEVKNVVV